MSYWKGTMAGSRSALLPAALAVLACVGAPALLTSFQMGYFLHFVIFCFKWARVATFCHILSGGGGGGGGGSSSSSSRKGAGRQRKAAEAVEWLPRSCYSRCCYFRCCCHRQTNATTENDEASFVCLCCLDEIIAIRFHAH